MARVAPVLATSGERVSSGLDWEAFYHANWRWMHQLVRRVGGPGIDVEDVVQDVFVVLVRRLDDFEGKSTLKTWMYRVCLNVVSEHRRRIIRRRRIFQAVDVVTFWRSPRTPAEEVESKNDLELVRSILERLPKKKREVFVLCEIEDLSRDEAAEILDIPTATVRTRLHHARKEFAKHLERERRAG